jgi:hypothetical protein
MSMMEKNNSQSPIFPTYISKWIIVPFTIFSWFTFLFIPYCIWLYLSKFHGGISDLISDYGQTGDFFGGMFNPLIAGMTLFVTVVIARQVQYYGGLQGDQQIRVQKQLFFTQLRFEAIKSLGQDIDALVVNLGHVVSRWNNKGHDEVIRQAAGQIVRRLHTFYETEAYIFNNFSDGDESEETRQSWKRLNEIVANLSSSIYPDEHGVWTKHTEEGCQKMIHHLVIEKKKLIRLLFREIEI